MTRKTNSAKSKSIITGILILMAYSMLASEVTDSKLIVLITDIISGFSVIGIATIFFTFFKQIAKPLSISYLSIKLIEGILMIVGGIFFIFNQGIREWIYESIHLYTFIVGGYLLYILLYKTQIVPKFISMGNHCYFLFNIINCTKIIRIKLSDIRYLFTSNHYQ